MSRLWAIAMGTVLILAACAIFHGREGEAPEVQEVPVPVAAAPAAFVAVETQPVLIDGEFEALLTEAKAKLPTREILLQKTEEELHQPPREVLDLGIEFGKIHDSLAAQPGLAPTGAKFFAECAGRDDLLTSVRAVCLRNARFWGATVTAPAEIEELAAVLPALKK